MTKERKSRVAGLQRGVAPPTKASVPPVAKSEEKAQKRPQRRLRGVATDAKAEALKVIKSARTDAVDAVKSIKANRAKKIASKSLTGRVIKLTANEIKVIGPLSNAVQDARAGHAEAGRQLRATQESMWDGIKALHPELDNYQISFDHVMEEISVAHELSDYEKELSKKHRAARIKQLTGQV